MKFNLIKNGVAVEIIDADITKMTDDDYKIVKSLLHNHLIVVLKNQDTNPWEYTRFIENLGSVANYGHFMHTTDGEIFNLKNVVSTDKWQGDKSKYPVQRVTGKKVNGQITGIFGTGILNWHANLNGLDRADGVVLQGWKDCENTSTSFLNTNIAYNDLSNEFLEEIKNVYCEYEYSPEIWAEGLPQYQLDIMKSKPSKYKMWLIQENIAGVRGIYFYTNNRCKVITENNELYQKLYDHLFQEKYIYQHWWNPGDIVLMDQILTLHKRDQNDPEILSKRILHRITFMISNYDNWLENKNQIS